VRAPTDPYPNVLRDVILARIDGKLDAALSLMESIRFEPAPRKTEKWPARAVIASVYAQDRYQCRYCGEKVILTPVMRLLARLYSEPFPYHTNWKADSTHPAFVSRSATLDHVIPIAGGGEPLERSNLVTACWGCNRRKGDLTLDEIGWSLVEPADPTWLGLTDLYIPLWEAAGRPRLGEDETWWMRAIRTRTSVSG
jgi:5-methylcytosine-specific restriction endonuclease McrA